MQVLHMGKLEEQPGTSSINGSTEGRQLTPLRLLLARGGGSPRRPSVDSPVLKSCLVWLRRRSLWGNPAVGEQNSQQIPGSTTLDIERSHLVRSPNETTQSFSTVLLGVRGDSFLHLLGAGSGWTRAGMPGSGSRESWNFHGDDV